MHLYYLANARDTQRLSIDGTIEPAHQCSPWYFDSEDAAKGHPAAAELTVYAVPAIETIPGARVGATLDDVDLAAAVYSMVAGEVHAIVMGL